MHTNTATSRQPIGGAETYFIRSGYRSRTEVEYFLDEMDDTVTWQPDVYPYAAAQAQKLGRDVVIEHLMNPMPALSLIRGLLMEGSAAAVLSTPARECRSGYDAPGPPRNPSHVREWASDEFQALLRASGFEIHYAGLTRSDDASNGLSTQLLLVGAGEMEGEQR